MDKQNTKLVKYLSNSSDGYNYKVFEFKDLCRDLRRDKSSLKQDLQYLNINDYVDIKYQDDEVVCLCLLSKSRQIEEQDNNKIYGLSVITKDILISGIFNAIMAFLGAFVAVLIIRWFSYAFKKRKNFNAINFFNLDSQTSINNDEDNYLFIKYIQ